MNIANENVANDSDETYCPELELQTVVMQNESSKSSYTPTFASSTYTPLKENSKPCRVNKINYYSSSQIVSDFVDRPITRYFARQLSQNKTSEEYMLLQQYLNIEYNYLSNTTKRKQSKIGKKESLKGKVNKKKNCIANVGKPVDIREATDLLTITKKTFLEKLKQRKEKRQLALQKETIAKESSQVNDSSLLGSFFLNKEIELQHMRRLDELAANYRNKFLQDLSSDSD